MLGSGSVVECLTRDRGPRVRASPASLRCVLEQYTLILDWFNQGKYPSLYTERLLMGRKESNQTNKAKRNYICPKTTQF